MKFYWKDVKTYTVEDLWRIFSNCGGSDLNVVGLPRQKAHGDLSCLLKQYSLKCARSCEQCWDVLMDSARLDVAVDSKDSFVKTVWFLELKKIYTALPKQNFEQTYFKVKSILHTNSHFFIEECAIETYGQNCTMVCGHCMKMSECNVIWICESGWNPGYVGFNCKVDMRCFPCIYCNIWKALGHLIASWEIVYGKIFY